MTFSNKRRRALQFYDELPRDLLRERNDAITRVFSTWSALANNP